MKIKRYLVINQNGTTKVLSSMPNLKWNEISILLEMEIPGSLFVRPVLTAKLSIDEKSVGPQQVTVEMKNDIEQAVRQSVGIEMKIIDQSTEAQ